MKKFNILIFSVVFILATSLTQALPDLFYTNFARTTGGGLVLNSTVNVRITIFDGATEVYKETFAGVTTDEFGLFTVLVGNGTPVAPFNAAMYDALIASNGLNILAESDAGDGYRFIELRSLLTTALRNAEVQGIVTLQSAYNAGNEIEVIAGLPVDLTGTGLIQSAASVADINANGPSTLTTKQYVDDAIAAIFPLPHITEGDAIEILPDGFYNGTTTQSIGVADNSLTNVKINDNTEFLEVEALGDGFADGTDVGSWSVTNFNRVLQFAGVGLTNVTRDGNIILIDGSDNWGMQVVESDATLIGDGTIGNELGVNQAYPFVWEADHVFEQNVDVLGNANVGGDFDVTGNTTLGGTLDVAGDATFDMNVDVQGNANVGGDFDVTGNTTLGGTLDVAGDATFDMNVDVQGNANVGGDFDVTGNTTLGGTLDVAGDATFDMNVDVQGNANVGGDFDVTGNTTLGGTLDVAGDAVFGMNVGITDDLAVGGNAGVSGNFDVIGNTTLGGTLDVAGDATFDMNVDVQGNANVAGDLNADGNTTLGGTLDVAGDATFDMNVDVQGNANVAGDLNADGNTTLNGDVALGDTDADVVVFNALVGSDILPASDDTYSFGSDANRWAEVYVGPSSLNIGTSGNNAVISYDLGNNWVNINTDLNVEGTIYGQTLNGGYNEGSVLFGDANGNIAENNNELFWDDNFGFFGIGTNAPLGKLEINSPAGDIALIVDGVEGDSSPDVLILGEVWLLGSQDGDAELYFNGGDGILMDGGASIIVDDGGMLYVDGDGLFGTDVYVSNDLFVTNNGDFGADVIIGNDLEVGNDASVGNNLEVVNDLNVGGLATFENIFVNEFATSGKTGAEIAAEPGDDLFVTKDYVVGGHFGSFNTLILFNPASGPAIVATSSDATAPTVTIENTHPDGTALQVQSNNASTTAIEIPTGNMNIGNGQLIVSANAGITTVPPAGQGPALTLSNFGSGGENGGAIFVAVGHSALSYNAYTHATTDYSDEPYTILDINAGAAMSITALPSSNVSGDMPGTLLYIINSGSATITLPGGLGTIPAGTVATFVNNGSTWFRIN